MNTLSLFNLSLLKTHNWFTTVWLAHFGFSPLQFHCLMVKLFFFPPKFCCSFLHAWIPFGFRVFELFRWSLTPVLLLFVSHQHSATKALLKSHPAFCVLPVPVCTCWNSCSSECSSVKSLQRASLSFSTEIILPGTWLVPDQNSRFSAKDSLINYFPPPAPPSQMYYSSLGKRFLFQESKPFL